MPLRFPSLKSLFAAPAATPSSTDTSLLPPAPVDDPPIAGATVPDLANWLESYASGNPAADQEFTHATQRYDSTRGGITTWRQDGALYDRWQEITERNLHVASLIEQRIAEVLSRPRRIVVDSESDKAIEARDFLEDALFEMPDPLGFGQRIGQMLNAQFWGFSVHEILYTLRPDDKIGVKRLSYCWPGQFVFDAEWNTYISRNLDAKMIPAPPGKFVITRGGFPLLWDNPYGNGILHKLRYLDKAKRYVEKWWLQYAEKNGAPTVVATIKQGVSDRNKLRRQVQSAMAKIGSMVGVILDEGVELDSFSRSASQTGATVHQFIIRYIENLEAKLIIGSTLTTSEAEHGTKAQAVVHQTTSEKRTEPDAKIITDVVNRQLVAPLLAYNYADLDPKERPYFSIETDPEENLNGKLDIIDGVVNRLRVPVSVAYIRELFGVPAPDSEEDETPGEPEQDPKPDPSDENDGAEMVDSTTVAEFKDREASFVTKAALARERSRDRADRALLTETSTKLRRVANAYGRAIRSNAVNGEITLESLASTPGDLLIPDDVEPWAWRAQALATVRAYADLSADFDEQGAGVLLAADSTARSTFDALPPDLVPYRQAIDWLLSRDILTESELADYEETIRSQGIDEAEVARVARDRALVFAGDVSAGVTEVFRDSIARAVQEGLTFKEWASLWDSFPVNELPGNGTQARLEVIYRNETNRVYHGQREALYQTEAVRAMLLGFDWYNPQDERSREDHAALVGFIPIDAPQASIVPPLDHNCRCAKFPVLKRRGRVAPEVDLDDLNRRWSSASRF